MSNTSPWEAARAARRRLENRIRVMCADYERMDPTGESAGDVTDALESTWQWFQGELQN